jgi:hypothetical protein
MIRLRQILRAMQARQLRVVAAQVQAVRVAMPLPRVRAAAAGAAISSSAWPT